MGLEEVGAKLVLEGQSQFLSGMKQAEDTSSGFGRTLSKIADGIAQGFGQQLFNAVSKGIGAIPNMIGKALDATMEWGQGLDDIGDILGTTTEQSAGLAAMFKTIGGDSRQLTQAMAKMSTGLLDAKGQFGTTGKALKSLGIDFQTANGKILPATDIFQMVADKIGNMPDGLEKTSLMMEIFGKSGKEMGDALQAAANGGVDLFIRQAQAMGLAIDPQQIIDNKKATETLDLAMQGLGITLMSAVLPFIKDVTYAFIHLLGDPSVKKVVTDISLVLGDVAKWLAEYVPAAIKTSVSFWDNILSPSLKGIWAWISDNLIPVFSSVKNWLSDNIPIAIAKVSKFFDDTMMPAIKGVSNWINDNLVPAYKSAIEWMTPKLQEAIQTVSTFVNDTMMPAMRGLVEYINGPVKIAFDSFILQLQSETPAAMDFLSIKIAELQRTFMDIRNYLDIYVVPIIVDVKDIMITLIEKALNPVKELLTGAFYKAWEGIATLLKIDVSGSFKGLQFDILTPLVNFFNGPLANALLKVHSALKAIKDLVDNFQMPTINIPGIGSSTPSPSGGGTTPTTPAPWTPYPGEPEMSRGGSFEIPMGFGYEGFNLGGLATASGGEIVTVTPNTMSAGPSVYNYSNATNYNLNLTTQQSSQSVQQSFAIMRMLAG